jgi:hypothetical protein
MLALLALAIVVLALVWLPFLILRVAFHVVIGLVLLPLKLLGLVLRIAFGVVGLVFRVVFSGIGLLAGLLAFVAFVVVLPLLPFALLAFGLWLVLREARPSRRALHVA